MQQLQIWFHVNGVIINNKKTIAVSFHTWQNKNFLKPQIIYKDMDTEYEYETKFLGLHLTEDIK
jgi:hypothetical protein